MIVKITFALAVMASIKKDLLGNGAWMFAHAIPVKGIQTCLNHQDCVGANRLCYRNQTMTEGNCICTEGFKPAKGNLIKCLDIKKNECESEEDCPNREPCMPPLGYISKMELLIDDVNLSFGSDPKKRCIFGFSNIIEPQLGGGLRQGPDFLDNLYSLGSHRHRHPADHITGEYVKFIEDAMLVLFLLCIMITLMMVHRATCRNFLRSHRSGPLRFIISQRDDQPPPYGNYDTNATIHVDQEINGDVADSVETNSTNLATSSGTQSNTGKLESRTETPPPTYDEALMISHAISMSTEETSPTQPVFVALPESSTPTVEDNPNPNPESFHINEDPPSYSTISCPERVPT